MNLFKKIFIVFLLSLFVYPSISFAQVEKTNNDTVDVTTKSATNVETTPSTAPSAGAKPSSVSGVKPISGDYYCGSSYEKRCDIFKDSAGALKRIMKLFMGVLGAFFVIWVAVYGLVYWNAKREGNTALLSETKKKFFNFFLGIFIIVLVVAGGYVAILQGIGVKPEFLQLIKQLFSDPFIGSAYAAFPDAIDSNTWYDFLLLAFAYAVKWFIYPMIIVIWVWTGFLYITAQGAPEKLKTAHKLLLVTFIITIVVLVAQGFFFAIQNTVNKIIGG